MRKALVLGGFLAGAAALRGCRRANVYSLRATERTALRRSSGREDGSAAGMAGAAWVPAAWTPSDWRPLGGRVVFPPPWPGRGGVAGSVGRGGESAPRRPT